MNNNFPFLHVTENMRSFDFSPWGGIEGFLDAAKSNRLSTNRQAVYKQFVPWLAKAVSMTSNAITSIPFKVVSDSGAELDSSMDWTNKLGGIEKPKQLIKKLSASLCGGSAYMIQEKTTRMIVDLQYLAPHTVTPQIDMNGLQYFDRASDTGKFDKIEPDNMLHFWLADSDVEIGPPYTFPLGSAANSASLLLSMDNTMVTYGERGFVPATILAAKGVPPTPDERKETEGWWNRFLKGWTSTIAKIINADSLDIKRVGAGLDELRGTYVELYRQGIENIGAAFGIPSGLFMSDNAYASEMDALRRQWYETSEFTSIYSCIEETFNEQLFGDYGAMWKFAPESLPVFQTDDKTKFERWTILVDKGVKNSLAAKIVSMDLPEGVEPESLDEKEKPPEPLQPDNQQVDNQQPQQPPQQPLTPDQTKDLKTWHDTSMRLWGKGKGAAIEFEPKALSEDMAEEIRAKLRHVTCEADIDKAFEIGVPVVESEADRLIRSLERSVRMAELEIMSRQGATK